METPDRMWVAQPRYPLIRRIFLPIYGLDQAIFFAVLVTIALIVGATFDREVGLYIGFGGYVGAMLVMEVTTPSALLVPDDCEARLIRLLDGSPFLRRNGSLYEWINARGRLYRWDSDTIRIRRNSRGLLVTGGHRDLDIVIQELRT